jgi:hypothetical protein
MTHTELHYENGLRDIPVRKPHAITYCVVQHSTGPQGGYVVRTAVDGWIAAPYSQAEKLAEYKRESAAQKLADRLNGRA